MRRKPESRINAAVLIRRLNEYATLDKYALFTRLKTRDRGLDPADIGILRERYGFNETAREGGNPRLSLLKAAADPFCIALLALSVPAFVAAVLMGTVEGILAAAVVAFPAVAGMLLRVFGELRALRVSRAPRVATTATVLRRDMGEEEIPSRELLPGDIIKLSAGDLVPADVRVLTAQDFFISQPALTGDTAPVEKDARLWGGEKRLSPFQLRDICLSGASVVSGWAVGVVVATGPEAFCAHVRRQPEGRQGAAFEKGMRSVGLAAARFGLLPAMILLLVGLFMGGGRQGILLALTAAAGLIPALPAALVPSVLQRAGRVMKKSGIVVRRPQAVYGLAMMDVLCTDKHGALTRPAADGLRCFDAYGEEAPSLLELAYLSSAFQTGVTNPVDLAVLREAELLSLPSPKEKYVKTDETPYDFDRRRSGVTLMPTRGGDGLLVVKGAPETVLPGCDSYDGSAVPEPLTDEVRDGIDAMAARLREQGYRVVAVAKKVLPTGDPGASAEHGFVFMGFVALLEPVYREAREAVAALQEAGVDVRMLTADGEQAARRVGGALCLQRDPVTGAEVEVLSQEELLTRVERTSLFARLSPSGKERVIQSLLLLGHTVGYLGDGIHAAAALRRADVGISVESAADAARECAGILLPRKELSLAARAAEISRRALGRVEARLRLTTGIAIGGMLSMTAGLLLLPVFPLLPMQSAALMLAVQLLALLLPGEGNAAARPFFWRRGAFLRGMLLTGAACVVADVLAGLSLWRWFSGEAALFQTSLFLAALLIRSILLTTGRGPKRRRKAASRPAEANEE